MFIEPYCKHQHHLRGREWLEVIRMPAAPTARKNAASGSGMVFSGIEMPAFEAVISCDTAGHVGGAAGNSNAY